jgi:hypothetical protein
MADGRSVVRQDVGFIWQRFEISNVLRLKSAFRWQGRTPLTFNQGAVRR